ncbi:hypothetical protein ACVWYO_003525 [Sphingomonas sp. UYP23]
MSAPAPRKTASATRRCAGNCCSSRRPISSSASPPTSPISQANAALRSIYAPVRACAPRRGNIPGRPDSPRNSAMRRPAPIRTTARPTLTRNSASTPMRAASPRSPTGTLDGSGRSPRSARGASGTGTPRTTGITPASRSRSPSTSPRARTSSARNCASPRTASIASAMSPAFISSTRRSRASRSASTARPRRAI